MRCKILNLISPTGRCAQRATEVAKGIRRVLAGATRAVAQVWDTLTGAIKNTPMGRVIRRVFGTTTYFFRRTGMYGQYYGDYGYGAPYNGFPEIKDNPLAGQTFEVCRQNFIALAIEQGKLRPDQRQIDFLREEIAKCPEDVRIRAFDAVVDDQGFGQPKTGEAIEHVNVKVDGLPYCCEHHSGAM